MTLTLLAFILTMLQEIVQHNEYPAQLIQAIIEIRSRTHTKSHTYTGVHTRTLLLCIWVDQIVGPTCHVSVLYAICV